MSRKTTRREFVQQTAAAAGAGATWWFSSNLGVAAQKERAKIERIHFACIGVGGKGSSDTDSAGRNGEVVALCDIDDNNLKAKARKFPNAKRFNDYREMLDEMKDKIDAVTVSTPDHTHAPASLRAMRLHKHCFTQKPLTWSVEEARLMRKTASEKKVATQMGNQGTAQNGLREAVEIVQSGGIGDVTQVHVWTNRPIWPQGEGRPTKTQSPPKNVHWDLFLGAAPYRPYSPVYHPFKWRGWLDFGTGALGDMACHTANMAVMAAKLFDPVSVEAVKTSGIVENDTYPKYSVLKWEFPKRGDLPPCTMFWYDGKQYPSRELLDEHIGDRRLSGSGSLIIGTKGSLFSPNDYGAKYYLFPEAKYKGYEKPKATLPRSPGHFKEYAIACKGGPPAMSNFNYAARLTETMILGNVALNARQKVEWDAKNMKVTNIHAGYIDPERLIRRKYRKGFGIAEA